LYFGKTEINSYEKGSSKEWILSNGKGGYASSTAIGVNVSENSGLLVAHYHGRRFVLVSKVDEKVVLRGKEYPLYTNKYKDMVYPDGYRYIQAFSLRSQPEFTFVVHDLIFKKEIAFLKDKGNSLLIRYIPVNVPEGVTLKVFPLVGLHYVGEERKEECAQRLVRGGVEVSCGDFSVFVLCRSGEYREMETAYENVIYEVEGGSEDLWSPGEFSFLLKAGEEIQVVVTDRGDFDIDEELVPMKVAYDNSLGGILSESARQLVVDRGGGRSILNDALVGKENIMDASVAFPGVMLSTSRFGDARRFLLYWLGYEDNGELPDSIEDGSPRYSDGASALWFLYACGEFFKKVKDEDFWSEVYPVISKLVNKKRSMAGDDYLLSMGDESNWMKQAVDRKGKLVEVNALWYNAVRFFTELSGFLGKDVSALERLSAGIKESFNAVFWNEDKGYLYDFVDGNVKCEDMRSNQVLAVGLTYPVVEGDRLISIVDKLWAWLYTTYGLRTLDPRNKRYKGRYDIVGKDKYKAMYRGMAWPWLLGFFINAVVRSKGEDAYSVVDILLEPFYAHLREQGIGFISQVFDGSMPYGPHGLRFSAISVGEVLRCYVENQLQRRDF